VARLSFSAEENGVRLQSIRAALGLVAVENNCNSALIAFAQFSRLASGKCESRWCFTLL